MPQYLFLDSAPLSLLATPLRPSNSAPVQAIRQWAIACDAAGYRLIVPAITDYEVRRELLRSGKTASLAELDRLKADLFYLPLTDNALLRAAELWAMARQQGQPTAHDENIDVDVILAAQVLTFGVSADIPLDNMVVVTVNLRHLTRFVPAALWTNTLP